MAKFYGDIGYMKPVETAPGVWSEMIKTKTYTGDIIRNMHRWIPSVEFYDDIATSTQISIIADPFAYEIIPFMRFVRWMGVSWKIINIDIQRPRLILTLGGVYNEP